MSITRRVAVGGLAALPFIQTKAQAQQPFPSKPCTFIVPFPAGGPADIFGRNLAERMSPLLGQPVLVENKSGAAGVTGVDFVAKAGTDAHVMGLMSASAGAIMQNLMPKMPYDPAKDIAPQILVVRVQEALAINSKLGIGDLKSFIAHAKANPGKVTCGSAGTGGITHLAIELFKRETGCDILHVPYRGAAPAMNDLIAGHIPMMFDNMPAMKPQIAGGKVRALAVAGAARSKLFPELPTMVEAGVPGFEASAWFGLVAPAATPADVMQTLVAGVDKALKNPDMAKKFADLGAEPGTVTGDAFGTFLKAEAAKWGKVVKDSGARVD